MENTAQFNKVTGILMGVAEKMARLESDPEVKSAADYWLERMGKAQAGKRAVNFARRGRRSEKPEGGK